MFNILAVENRINTFNLPDDRGFPELSLQVHGDWKSKQRPSHV